MAGKKNQKTDPNDADSSMTFTQNYIVYCNLSRSYATHHPTQLMQVLVVQLHFVARHDKIMSLWLKLGGTKRSIELVVCLSWNNPCLWDQYSLSAGHTHIWSVAKSWQDSIETVPCEDHCDWQPQLAYNHALPRCSNSGTSCQWSAAAPHNHLHWTKKVIRPNTQEMETRNITEKESCVDNGFLTFVYTYIYNYIYINTYIRINMCVYACFFIYLYIYHI